MKAPWLGAQRKRAALAALAGAGAAALLAGCGSAATSPGVQPGGPLRGSGPTNVTVAQNGATVHIQAGAAVALVDFPSNWFPKSSDPAVLGDPVVVPGRTLCKASTEVANPPGVPCTQIPLDYVGEKAGTAVLSAHRTQCGEAMRCVTPQDSDFRLTVVVG